MPMPTSRAQDLNNTFIAELLRSEPPFYGVNVIDFDNLELFTERMQPLRAHFSALRGFRPHLRALKNEGTRKRMLVVNMYGPDLNPSDLRQMLENPACISAAVAALEVVEDWLFFTARDV